MSNSKLLEEAIIDAEALREAALKNAEQTILEKYAPEVKTAIESLLEQELPGGPDSMMADEAAMTSQPNQELDVSLAATDGEKLCPCPDNDESVTISLGYLKNKLEKMIMDVSSEASVPGEEEPMGMAPDMAQEPMDMAPEATPTTPEEEEEEEELPEEEPALQEEKQLTLESDGEIEIDDSLLESLLSEQEGLSAQQKQFLQNHRDPRGALLYWKSFPEDSPERMDAIEILTARLGPEEVEATLEKDKASNRRMIKDLGDKLKSGKTDSTDVRPSTDSHKFGKRGADYVRPTGLEESKKQDSKVLVENKKVLKENKLLAEKLTKLLEQHNEILEENKKVKQAALQISQRLEETNLSNAILLYKNQALGSDSLNERQKNKIVEAVSKAGSVDEVKMIYETLCNAVGSFDSKGPQSLSEAVEQRGGMTLKPRQEKSSNSNPLHSRWQKIAGIKK